MAHANARDVSTAGRAGAGVWAWARRRAERRRAGSSGRAAYALPSKTRSERQRGFWVAHANARDVSTAGLRAVEVLF